MCHQQPFREYRELTGLHTGGPPPYSSCQTTAYPPVVGVSQPSHPSNVVVDPVVSPYPPVVGVSQPFDPSNVVVDPVVLPSIYGHPPLTTSQKCLRNVVSINIEF